MLRSLEINNFRCFDHFEMKGVARVNLLVGTNNSGKTSLLEAVELWASKDWLAFFNGLHRRGEYSEERTASPHEPEFAVRHLFHGHTLGQKFRIVGEEDSTRRFANAAIRTLNPDDPVDNSSEKNTTLKRGTPHFLYSKGVLPSSGEETEHFGPPFPLSSRNGITAPHQWYGGRGQSEQEPTVRFVTTHSLSAADVTEMFSEVVLTEEEELITSALKSIEPSVERIAPIAGYHAADRGGIVVRCSGQKERIPIGSMGDGIWRILSLALALVNARGGFLLVDEIDTGLHFSVMNDMWKLVTQTAQRLDVQVFATTHSRDCYESLATVLQNGENGDCTAAIHRIEREKGRAVAFDEQEIIIAAERGLEVR